MKNSTKTEDNLAALLNIKLLAEEEAQGWFGTSAKEVFRMLDNGDLKGTLAEVEFKSLRWLAGESK